MTKAAILDPASAAGQRRMRRAHAFAQAIHHNSVDALMAGVISIELYVKLITDWKYADYSMRISHIGQSMLVRQGDSVSATIAVATLTSRAYPQEDGSIKTVTSSEVSPAAWGVAPQQTILPLD